MQQLKWRDRVLLIIMTPVAGLFVNLSFFT
jgi:hypothetical protein